MRKWGKRCTLPLVAAATLALGEVLQAATIFVTPASESDPFKLLKGELTNDLWAADFPATRMENDGFLPVFFASPEGTVIVRVFVADGQIVNHDAEHQIEEAVFGRYGIHAQVVGSTSTRINSSGLTTYDRDWTGTKLAAVEAAFLKLVPPNEVGVFYLTQLLASGGVLRGFTFGSGNRWVVLLGPQRAIDTRPHELAHALLGPNAVYNVCDPKDAGHSCDRTNLLANGRIRLIPASLEDLKERNVDQLTPEQISKMRSTPLYRPIPASAINPRHPMLVEQLIHEPPVEPEAVASSYLAEQSYTLIDNLSTGRSVPEPDSIDFVGICLAAIALAHGLGRVNRHKRHRAARHSRIG